MNIIIKKLIKIIKEKQIKIFYLLKKLIKIITEKQIKIFYLLKNEINKKIKDKIFLNENFYLFFLISILLFFFIFFKLINYYKNRNENNKNNEQNKNNLNKKNILKNDVIKFNDFDLNYENKINDSISVNDLIKSNDLNKIIQNNINENQNNINNNINKNFTLSELNNDSKLNDSKLNNFVLLIDRDQDENINLMIVTNITTYNNLNKYIYDSYNLILDTYIKNNFEICENVLILQKVNKNKYFINFIEYILKNSNNDEKSDIIINIYDYNGINYTFITDIIKSMNNKITIKSTKMKDDISYEAILIYYHYNYNQQNIIFRDLNSIFETSIQESAYVYKLNKKIINELENINYVIDENSYIKNNLLKFITLCHIFTSQTK